MNKTNTRAMVETAFVSAIGVMLGAISVYALFRFLAFFGYPCSHWNNWNKMGPQV